jgi:hypothetical protein
MHRLPSQIEFSVVQGLVVLAARGRGTAGGLETRKEWAGLGEVKASSGAPAAMGHTPPPYPLQQPNPAPAAASPGTVTQIWADPYHFCFSRTARAGLS